MKHIFSTLVAMTAVANTQTMDFAFDKAKRPDSITISRKNKDDGSVVFTAQLRRDSYSETIQARRFTCSLSGKEEYSCLSINCLQKKSVSHGETACASFNTLRSLHEQENIKKAQTIQTTEGKN